jgi:hypothetical protein
MSYFSNVKAWVKGFGRFDEIDFKPGWSGKSIAWWLLYGIDYGTRVLTGGACISWSRWFYDNSRWRPAKFATRLLNRLDPNHGAESGPALWGTEDTRFAKGGAFLFWGGLILLVLSWTL